MVSKKAWLIRNEDNIITATELYTYLQKSVSKLSGFSQTPRFNYLSNDEGEFVFNIEMEEKDEITPTMTAIEDIASADKFGSLIINSMPSTASVTFDSKHIGNTPFEKTLPQGQYLIKIEKENYQPEITMVNVKEGLKTKLDIPLSFSKLYIDKTLRKYNIRKKNQTLIRYGSLLITLISTYYTFEHYNDAKSLYQQYKRETNLDMIGHSYNDYQSKYHSFNISASISISSALITTWTFIKPIKKPKL